MQLKDQADAPVADTERTESAEKARRVIQPGHKLVLAASGAIALAMIGWGIYSQLNAQSRPARPAAKAPENKAPTSPKLNVSLAGTQQPTPAPGSDNGTCPDGRRLPPGMPCPDQPAAAAGAASQPTSEHNSQQQAGQSGSSGGGGGSGKPSPAEELRKRRFAGELSVASVGPARDNRAVPTMGGQVQPVGGSTPPPLSGTAARAGAGPLGSQLNATETPAAIAKYKLNQSLTLSRGTLPDCTLMTAVKTSQPGFLRCVLSQPVYSMNGEVILMEAGTTVNGEYTQGLQAGQTSIFALWTDAVTPKGVTLQLNSPSTDPLGRAGMSGEVDNKWFERFSGAVFFSIFDDVSNIALAKASQQGGSNNIALYPNTTGTSKALVEEMLKQGSQIKPELYKNQGEIVRIFVARDIDFSSVYQLEAKEQ